MESRLARLIRELKVPAVVLFIMVTVWSVGYSEDLERDLRRFHVPAPVHPRIPFAQDDTPEVVPAVAGADDFDLVDDD